MSGRLRRLPTLTASLPEVPGPLLVVAAAVAILVLAAVVARLLVRPTARRPDTPIGPDTDARSGAALCLSGGGLRAMAFSLGLLQALHRSGRPTDSLPGTLR